MLKRGYWHDRALQYQLRTLAEHRHGARILSALVTLADCGPYHLPAAEAVDGLVRSILSRDGDDIAALRMVHSAAARDGASCSSVL